MPARCGRSLAWPDQTLLSRESRAWPRETSVDNIVAQFVMASVWCQEAEGRQFFRLPTTTSTKMPESSCLVVTDRWQVRVRFC